MGWECWRTNAPPDRIAPGYWGARPIRCTRRFHRSSPRLHTDAIWRRAGIGVVVCVDRASLRIHPADKPTVTGCQPEYPPAVADQPVRRRIGRLQPVFADLAGARGETAQLDGFPLGEPERSVRRRRR